MSDDGMSDAERRVWSALPDGVRGTLDALPASDLTTLLLSLAQTRAARVRPPEVLRRWREDRFVRPADRDPRATAAVQALLWDLLPAEVAGVELSPVVPLGTCAAVTPGSQNRIVTATRSLEVLSDPTNALAVEAADRRLRGGGPGEVHLAASHRVLRAQRFDAGMQTHFRLFALVSSARDTGSGRTEARLLTLHLDYWQRVLARLVPSAAPRLRFTVLDSPVLRERVADTVLPTLAAGGVPLVEEPDRTGGRGYYVGAALGLTATHGGETVEFGDGGFTTWTARLTSDAKERCLTSCVSVDRLTALATG
ncbi:hypothetical protein ACH4T9_06005 [Micromonospora sp. NPDC020750]|uniref:hypothetical protein n=1 Tax=unclassified Micromonospora TaxID=2617518 RepID=UPI00379BD80B